MFYSPLVWAKGRLPRCAVCRHDLPPSLIALYGLTVFIIGAVRFWRKIRDQFLANRSCRSVARDQRRFGLAYMKGGGAGCNYPAENFSRARMWYHHLVFYGFLLDFAATTIAAFDDHFSVAGAVPYFSAPVVLGTVGGMGLMIGTVGLLHLKWKSDRTPADEAC